MKDHIETDAELRIRQYEAMSAEQKAMVFNKITAAFGNDGGLEDAKKLADKTIKAVARARKPATKVGQLAQGYRELGQLRDEATVLFLGLVQAGESPDPDAYWQYHAEITVLMNRLELLRGYRVFQCGSRDNDRSKTGGSEGVLCDRATVAP